MPCNDVALSMVASGQHTFLCWSWHHSAYMLSWGEKISPKISDRKLLHPAPTNQHGILG